MWTSVRRFKKPLIILVSLFFVLTVVLISIFSSNKIKRTVTVEAGGEAPDVSEFMKDKNNSGVFITDLSSINMSIPGIYEIKIQIGDKVYSSKLKIKDTVAPVAEAVSQEAWPKEEKEAKEFVRNIIDVTDVKVSFKEKPDFSRTGVQEVFLILEDTSGNKTELKSSLTIKVDTEGPKIEGADNQTVYIGDKVSYKSGVTVTDNRDKNVELAVDNNAVNLKKVGSYKVIYSATDISGNTTTKTVEITVKEKPKNYVSEEELNALVDKVLASIINKGMTDKEKAYAIYKWTKGHITYTGSSDKSDWMIGAAQGIKKGTGDCFNYYATSRALLTRVGFKNLCVTRVGGKTQHFWNLVYIQGGWYHFDTTPSRRGYPYVCFLRTDSEVAEYSKKCTGYFNFDRTKYPATPLKPFR